MYKLEIQDFKLGDISFWILNKKIGKYTSLIHIDTNIIKILINSKINNWSNFLLFLVCFKSYNYKCTRIITPQSPVIKYIKKNS